MIDIEQVIKEVALRLNENVDVVSTICKHPFLETVRIMKDDTETKNILFNQLFKFKLKRRYKENKSKEYSSK